MYIYGQLNTLYRIFRMQTMAMPRICHHPSHSNVNEYDYYRCNMTQTLNARLKLCYNNIDCQLSIFMHKQQKTKGPTHIVLMCYMTDIKLRQHQTNNNKAHCYWSIL